jgi:iron complex outermembrane receptor protein
MSDQSTTALRTVLLAATILSSPLIANRAFAQAAETSAAVGAETSAAVGQEGTGLEQIVVTAQRRGENLQKVNVAATALSADALDDKAVVNLNDLQYAAPSLSLAYNGLTSAVNIRGVGLASGSASVSNGVAYYKDGIFQPQIATNGSLFDVGSVEVLRGPQGTFVGSNSTGGAIFVNSVSPTLERVLGYVEGELGSYNRRELQGAVNLPVGDTLAIRFAGQKRDRDSYFHDIGPFNNEPDSRDEIGGRVGILWHPGKFQALIKAEHNVYETGGYAYQPIRGVGGSAYQAYRQADNRILNYDDRTENTEKKFQVSGEFRYKLDSGLTFRLLSGYQYNSTKNLYDNDATNKAASYPAGPPKVSQDQFTWERIHTEEVNIISPTDRRFSWIVGGYYQDNTIFYAINQVSAGFPTFITGDKFKKRTTGLFGQGTFRFTDTLALDLGVRYSEFKTTGQGRVVVGIGVPASPFNTVGLQVADLGGEYSDSKFTGKAALNWTPNADTLIYAFVARGYKPGNYLTRTTSFEPETVLDYEIGYKGSFAHDMFRTQVGAFYYDYSNFQTEARNVASGQTAVTNLADAAIKGVEANVQGRLGGLRIDGAVSYVDSKLSATTFVNNRAFGAAFPGLTLPQCAPGVAQTTPPTTCVNYTPFLTTTDGGPNLFSPKWSFNAGVEYEFKVGDEVTLTPRLNYAYLSEQFVNILYNPVLDKLPSRGLLSARLSLQYRSFLVEGYATNLTKEVYTVGQTGNNEFFGAPREYGLRVRASF